jgi:hypothetical protein
VTAGTQWCICLPVYMRCATCLTFSHVPTPPASSTAGDQPAATGNRAFLLAFLKRFPHLASKDLYLAGESYAGEPCGVSTSVCCLCMCACLCVCVVCVVCVYVFVYAFLFGDGDSKQLYR